MVLVLGNRLVHKSFEPSSVSDGVQRHCNLLNLEDKIARPLRWPEAIVAVPVLLTTGGLRRRLFAEGVNGRGVGVHLVAVSFLSAFSVEEQHAERGIGAGSREGTSVLNRG